MLCGLIMAGGKGTRFWPLSTEKKPKQFLNLLCKETMIQMTVKRINPIIPLSRIFICTIEPYIELVEEQVPELPKENIIVEPEGRNTAPSITLASLIIERKYKNADLIVLPADHLIKDEKSFRKIIINCSKYLKLNNKAIITIGMKPERPETGYGYIKQSNNVKEIEGYKITKVEKFVEKPDLETAKQYLNEGNYLWNGGIFIWTISSILSEIRELSPEIYEPLKKLKTCNDSEISMIVNSNYSKIKSISIDYAVLEKSKDVYVVQVDIGWDDIGTWKAVERYKRKDNQNNIIEGNAKLIECKSNIAINNKKKLIMIGIEGVMTLETSDSIYIINKGYISDLNYYKKYLNNF